jgi:hypothetical protein
VVVDVTPPQLQVTSPTDYQVFTNADITVAGTASDINGITNVTINGSPAPLSGTNWSNGFTLSLGTNTLSVIATDNSAQMNTATQVVHAVWSPPTNNIPRIASGPVVTNALLQVGTVALVVANETNTFLVTATDADNDTLDYQWVFGDGASTNTAIGIVDHVSTNECGPYDASVTVSDGQASTNSELTVVVACQMQVTKLQVKTNFKKAGADSWNLTAIVALPDGFSLGGQSVTLEVGGAPAAFSLNAKGVGVNTQGNCHLVFKKKTNTWTLTAKMQKGDWQDLWIKYGLVNADVPKMRGSVTLPVIVLAGNEGFVADKTLLYTAKAGKSGTAK